RWSWKTSAAARDPAPSTTGTVSVVPERSHHGQAHRRPGFRPAHCRRLTAGLRGLPGLVRLSYPPAPAYRLSTRRFGGRSRIVAANAGPAPAAGSRSPRPAAAGPAAPAKDEV